MCARSPGLAIIQNMSPMQSPFGPRIRVWTARASSPLLNHGYSPVFRIMRPMKSRTAKAAVNRRPVGTPRRSFEKSQKTVFCHPT
jgi:hypothetical protein